MQTAIYMRVSTEEQDISLQKREISIFLELKGIRDYQIYKDVGFSGKNDVRPDFKRLLDDCKQGKVEFLVVWKLDRLFRSLRHLISFLDDLKAMDIKFAAVQDNVDLSTPAGELMANMIGSFAQFERSLISQRTKAGMQAKKALGDHMGRKTNLSDETVKLIHIAIDQGLPPNKIAMQYNARIHQIRHIIKQRQKLIQLKPS